MLDKETNIKIAIDEEKCISCGICTNICPGYLEMVNKKVKVSDDSPFGCIQCGNCMMLCPKECISVKGKWVSKDKISPLVGHKPHVDDLFYLFKKRRSIRKFKDQVIEKEVLEKIIDAGTTAPMGLPPSDLKVLVINGKDNVHTFGDDLCKAFVEMLNFFKPIVLASFRPILGKVQYRIYKEFILPIIKDTVEKWDKGEDILFYNAPAVIVFYGNEFSILEDAVLASTHCQIAADALGLGSCVIGSIGPGLEKSKKTRAKYGIKKGDKVHTGFILGYPVTEFKRSVKREFLEVKYI